MGFLLKLLFFVVCVCSSQSYSRKDLNKINCESGNSVEFDFCASILCEKITDCPNGRIVANASYCNCCDACVPVKKEGEYCDEIRNKVYMKYKRISQCETGLKCQENKCVIDDSPHSCSALFRHFGQLRGKHMYSDELWAPNCDEQGYFGAKQTKNKKSICVTIRGETIFGHEETALSENMTCSCSRHMKSLLENEESNFMTNVQEHCDSDGNFQNLQCINDLCYCAEPSTGKVIGKIVTIMHRNKLPCYKSKDPNEVYLLPCEEELQRTRSLIYQFTTKGINIFGLEKVQCDPDGTFSPKQCDSEGCACTDEYGMVIRSYHTDDHNIQAQMKCDCARDAEVSKSHARYSEFNCNRYGSYALLQCLSPSQCFCIDNDGEVISRQFDRAIAEKNEFFCKQLLANLTMKSKDPPEFATTTTTEMDDSSDDYDGDYDD